MSYRLGRSMVLVASSAFVWLACSTDDSAEVLVVTSEQNGPLDLDEIVLTVERGTAEAPLRQERVNARVRYEAGRLRPWSVTVRPQTSSDVGAVLYRFRVDGIRGGRPVVTRRARLAFVGGLTLTLPMRLSASCVYIECAEDETCEEAVCRDPFVPSCALAPMGASCREPAIDGGTVRDAAPLDASLDATVRDSAVRDAGARDAGGSIDASRDAAPAVDARSCFPMEWDCDGGNDDDCDGLADCADPDCTGIACNDGDDCTFADQCDGSGCSGTPVVCASDACVTRACNGTASCTVANAPDGTFCADDGNPCSFDLCAAGACTHPQVFDNTILFGTALCCGGAVVDSATHGAHCGVCGNDCGGRECAGGVCRCTTNGECRGTCFDGVDLPACTGDGGGFLCQCQGDGDCLGGQTCCFESPPGCRHVCRFGC